MALVLAATLVALFVGVAIAQGIGDPSVPSGDVAVVEEAPNSHISTEEFDAALDQAAASQGAQEVPPESDPQYAALRETAVSNLLAGRWVRGEAAERGISLSDSEVDNQVEQIKKQYGGEKGFQRLLEQAHFTPEQARDQIELRVLSGRLDQEIVPPDSPPAVSDSEIEDFYEANKAQFEQPETRDVREIVNRDQAKVGRAQAVLARDDSPASWKKVAARFSTEGDTKDTGGLRRGVAQGQSDPALEEQIFSAPEGELVGPFQAQGSSYLIQVVKVTPAETTPLSEVSQQVGQQLAQGKQQQIRQDVQGDIVAKWVSRSFCADDYLVNSCANFTPSESDACTGDDPGEESQGSLGCPAFVTPRPAVPPGRATVFPGQPIPALPQGPISPPTTQPGIIGPPGGALPPGAVPPGGAPAPTPTP